MPFEDVLKDMQARTERALGMGGPEKLAQRKAQGALNARERLARLFDPGTFIESGRYAVSARAEDKDSTPADGKVAGFGRIHWVAAGDVVLDAGAVGALPGQEAGVLAHMNADHADAVQLFAQRARAASPDFTLSATNGSVIADICGQLDGLPLAIELAAARVRHFTPDMLLARLERRLPLLSDGPRDAPTHQRTLTATIAWSYELLDDAGRRLLRSIAIFAGGCAIEAAMRAYEREGARLAAAARGVEVVAGALRGERWVPRL